MSGVILNFLFAALGTVGFIILFHVPVKYVPICALVGGFGWTLTYCLIEFAGMPYGLATLFGTILAMLLSRFMAVAMRCPTIIFLISGIIPVVPGGSVYRTVVYLVTGQSAMARSTGIMAVQTAIAIVLGIVIVMEIPGKIFKHEWKHEKT